ncbi:MAG TPA: MaoC/PaaZ C-terminal domain-containing protein [Actinomycetota bacterium]|nr:MaoC/PaaZ C-terminal domain-containing protein [Actinomycetota bacterium]
MAINTGAVGRTYPSSTYLVTAEAIRAYAAATNEDNPVFTGADPVAPPAFPVVPGASILAAALFDPELGVNLARLVHGEEDHRLHVPIRPGDQLAVAGSLEAVDIKETGETFTVYTSLTNQDGVLAAELRSMMFVRGSGSRSRAAGAGEAAPQPELAFSAVQKVDEDQTYRYAEASGDHNPIHTDPEFARNAAGLPGIILHGMATMAFAGKVILDEACAGDPARLQRLKVRFSKPVFPGETLTTRVWLAPGGASGGVVTYEFETLNTRGSAVLKNGIAEVREGG